MKGELDGALGHRSSTAVRGKSRPVVGAASPGAQHAPAPRVASSEDTALASTGTTVAVALIYVGTITLYVGSTAWLVRVWTRRRYCRSPSDLLYWGVGAALIVNSGIAIVVASLIVTALGYNR